MDLKELSEALSGMDPAELALGAGLVGIIGTLMIVGSAVWYILTAIGYYKMFQKAGQRSWFAFIPVLREYGLFRMAWTLKAFIISTVMLAVVQLGGGSESVIVGLVVAVVGIAWIVMQVKLVRRLAKSFGKGNGWAVLLFFVPFIAALILGFGSAEYVGNPEEKKEETAQIEA